MKKVPILLKASLVVITLPTAMSKTATIPRTQEWKHKKVCQVRFPVVIPESRCFITLKLWTGAKTA